ncbi:MAG TPA: hypothetical protein VGL97_08235 [Bryobacteraceae bacterium]|jgi:hypothetical protein
MFGAVNNFLEKPKQVLLSWSESLDSPKKQEIGQIISIRGADAVIRIAVPIVVGTTVLVTGKYYTGNGIVQSYRKEFETFILTLSKSDDIPFKGSKRDPGMVVVDNFLTEDEEAQILKDLKNETMRAALFPELSLYWSGLDTSASIS